MGPKSTQKGGEIVQVQGGHIIRATGCKDRHSKVFTAKGPRDRRVRLAAHTAIQFYDVQDRLGYDRPSKAVDWLMNKAKDSIDKLAELPPWDPLVSINSNNNGNDNGNGDNNNIVGLNEEMSLGGGENNTSFQNYPQDLCLSLHSYHDPGSGHAGGSSHQQNHHPGHDHSLFHGGFDGGWGGPQHDVDRFTRLMGWDGGSGGGVEVRGGIMFNNSAPLMSNYSQNQRGTLQSNYSPFGRGFEEINNHNQNQQSISSIGYGSGSDHNLMGFYIPSQIDGGLHGGASLSNNRASSSSLSRDSTPH